jgi:hypothetical protein
MTSKNENFRRNLSHKKKLGKKKIFFALKYSKKNSKQTNGLLFFKFNLASLQNSIKILKNRNFIENLAL